ncbi:Uncharacterised protein [Mycobacteroides abscessus subsp. abscessus]|nr:Uncharacterised protein [Mycobacteroides abscessus subsp. abscessus]
MRGVRRGEAAQQLDQAQHVLPVGRVGGADPAQPVEQFLFAVQAFLRLADEVADQGGRSEPRVVERAGDLAQ